MFASATSGDRPNNSKFSSCSVGNISNVLDAIEDNKKRNCFSGECGVAFINYLEVTCRIYTFCILWFVCKIWKSLKKSERITFQCLLHSVTVFHGLCTKFC